MAISNYGGRQQSNTSQVKQFFYGLPLSLWRKFTYHKLNGTSEELITTTTDNPLSVYIKGDLFVNGNIHAMSDETLKHNIVGLDDENSDKIMNLKPCSFNFENDLSINYGFIAQDLEMVYPELVRTNPVNTYKCIKKDYIVPLLVKKIQKMQREIDDIKRSVNTNNN